MMLEKFRAAFNENIVARTFRPLEENENQNTTINPVSYTHLRAHET